ncbi:Signal transduction histidine kinase [Tistlia consotensis]|uniref:histidine kinase n=1 Tax=Tistlia consotensis USBA 355 TaxID=560819 RepID=A0A1Y6C7G6_9PROT|nr:ATP-binding protein [Tistlia consotensis]SMF46212.1 two-component system, sensor histidine kinase ChiS [Tistlia consotensis USBA 355]SNR78781.1 Signal transduction histidine kinase [Tistlia consotensis]
MTRLRPVLDRLQDLRTSPIWRKAIARVLFLVFVCGTIAALAEQVAHQDTLNRVRSEALERLGVLRVALERTLSSDVQRVRGLVAYTRGNPDLDQAEFESVAKYLMSDGSGIVRNVALARDLVITHVYPLAGNEKALGLRYRDNAAQWPMVAEAIAKNEITIAGPLPLVQGGTGVIARFPIFLPGVTGEAHRLWGIASMVIDFAALLKQVGLDRYLQDYDLVIYGRDGQGLHGEPFLGTPAALQGPPVVLDVHLTSGSWVVEATPRDGWPTRSRWLWVIVGCVLAVFAVGMVLALWTVRYEQALVESAAQIERARQEAVAARRAAEQANHAKTLFLSNMSHELRTPLNAIIGFTQIMAREAFGPIDNPRYRSYLADIHRSSQHLFELIRDILDISRIESGEVEVRDAELDLAEAVGASLHLLRPKIEEKRISLQPRLAADLPRLRADPTLLRQILLNIVGNAVKFTPAGGEIRVEADWNPGTGISIRISDSGPGIEPELASRALEPFVQLKHAHDVAHEGTGLGLPIARRLMEAHGGRLTLVGRPPQGTTVVLDFPEARTIRVAAGPARVGSRA